MDTRNRDWLVLRHVEHEHIGSLAGVLRRAAITCRYADVFRGDPVPQSSQQLGGLVVMGGPMGVYESDRYAFLNDELALIRRATQDGLPVLGICLGAQLIAAALGAKVYPGPAKEIGWHRVEVVAQDDFTSALPASFMGFHWHGDTFDLPAGAVRLFRSRLYENQGFRIGENVLALQFHVEVAAAMIEEWLEDPGCRAELDAAGIDAGPIRAGTLQWAAPLEALSEPMFRRFLSCTAGA